MTHPIAGLPPTLSALLRLDTFKFTDTPAPGAPEADWMNFAGCACLALGLPLDLDGKSFEVLSEAFPLAFACPLFVGGGYHLATHIVSRNIPGECKLPKQAGIYFVCDLIDTMARMFHYTPAQVAGVIEKIEAAFAAYKLDTTGRIIQ